VSDQIRDFVGPEDYEAAERFFGEVSADAIAVTLDVDSEPSLRLRLGDQPLPREVPGVPSSHELVIADLARWFPDSAASRELMAARARLGLERYGQPLRPNNGRDTRRDATEEAADLVAYLMTLLREGDGVDVKYHMALRIYVGLVEGK
jgi:hypothetical protein